MYGDENFFVMVTKTSFGVFAFDATDYPEEFIKNIKYVCVKNKSELNELSGESSGMLGRNLLNKNRFRMPYSVGKIYRRC